MKSIELRESDFRREIEKYSFPVEMKKEFFDYWSEPDRAPQPKMRFEKEKTWDLSRRLSRWSRNGFGKYSDEPKKIEKQVKDPQLARLDGFLEVYRTNHLRIQFSDFGKHYEYMKEMKLLKKFSKEEIETIKTVYKNDNEKCRCACVQMSLDGYVNNGLKPSDIIEMRKQLL